MMAETSVTRVTVTVTVSVTRLDGSVSTYEVGGTTVGDVERVRAKEREDHTQQQYLRAGVRLDLGTKLEGLADSDGVVRLVEISYTGSGKKRRAGRKAVGKRGAEEAEAEAEGALLPFFPGSKRYSLDREGLDDADQYRQDSKAGVSGGTTGTRTTETRKTETRTTETRTTETRKTETRKTETLPAALSCPTQLLPLLKSKYKDRLHYQQTIPGRSGSSVDLEEVGDVPRALKGALKQAGIERLYEHQVEAWKRRDRDFIVTTSTSSGKSLCYLLPTLMMLAEEEEGVAIVMYPTKALANDQLAKVRAMVGHVLGSSSLVGILDGDVSQEDRDALCSDKPRLLLTNPDFLSMALPYHESRYRWLFENLSVVVLDEAHVYSGAFGAHVAMVVRRLKRLAKRRGGGLRFYLSSATLSNAAEFARTLVGEDVLVIDTDTSPSSERTMVVWLPGLMARSAHRRKSPVYESAVLLAECMQKGLPTIVFAKTRKLAELVYSYGVEILTASSKDEGTRGLATSLAVYRAGFSPRERRDIEERLVRGDLKGVVATNALELGIDIGGLDCSVHLGWQGSRSSLWQQAGRTGRRGRKSLAFFVPFQGVLDDFFVRNPAQLFDPAGIEPTVLSLSNAHIVGSHLRAAAYERPLVPDVELEPFGGAAEAAADRLIREGDLSRLPTKGNAHALAYTGSELNPAGFQLRSIDADVVTIIERGSSNVLEQIERFKAPFVVYPGASYSKRGKSYLIEDVDWNGAGIAHAVPANLAYYTTVVDCTAIKTKTTLPSLEAQPTPAEVVIRFSAFCRRRRQSGLAIDTVRLHGVPEVRYETTAMTVALLPEGRREEGPETEGAETKGAETEKPGTERPGSFPAEAVHAAAHAMIAVMPRFLGVGDADIGAEACNVDHFVTSRLLLFDRHGAFGLSERIASMFGDVVEAAIQCLEGCACKDGCPSCCHLGACPTYNQNCDKVGGLGLLQALRERS